MTILQAIQLSSLYTIFHPIMPCPSHGVCDDAFSDMLHSLSGFPFQISRGMIGCGFTAWYFTYCFLKTDFQLATGGKWAALMGARIDHGNEEVKSCVCIRHNEEQRCFLVAQGIQLQFVIGGNITDFLNIKRSQTSAAGNQDGFCGFAWNEMSRTF